MKVTVHGGTHLGIVGCYGQKTFELFGKRTDIRDELRELIQEDSVGSNYNLKGAEFHKGRLVTDWENTSGAVRRVKETEDKDYFYWENKDGEILFECRIVKVEV
jgi:GH43 family beta-xylosidase